MPKTYPHCPKSGRPLPDDHDLVLAWLDTATHDELDWYFRRMGVVNTSG